MTRGIPNDHLGKRFGALIVIARSESDGQKNARWLCKCDCGAEQIVRSAFLKRGQKFCSKQCPVYRRHAMSDITGQRFGRLTAVNLMGRGRAGKSIWRFSCDCGQLVERTASNVLTGDIRSCGCLGVESRIKHGLSQTKEYHREAHRKWAKANPARSLENVKKRRKDFEIRIPAWLTAKHRRQIDDIYREAQRLTIETGIEHHVDHIIPLRGKTVSGLHVPWNLQAITATENLHKSRKLPDDVC